MSAESVELKLQRDRFLYRWLNGGVPPVVEW